MKVEKVVLDRGQVSAQLLKGAGTKALLMSIAERVAAQSGLDTEISTYDGVNRSNVSVTTATQEDYFRNLNTNALAKALY